MAKIEPVDEFQREVHELTAALVGCSLVDDQNWIFQKVTGNRATGTRVVELRANYWSDPDVNVLASIPYSDLHAHLTEKRAYDLKFLDGALVQFSFEFDSQSSSRRLRRSRLAYLPSPDLTPFQQDPAIYLDEEIFGDVVDLRAVTTPLRFDYDARDEVVVDVHHPAAHVTFGQYPHCRIAATGPVTPFYFIEFIVRSFYRTKTNVPTDKLPRPRLTSQATITSNELALVHFGVPTIEA